MRGARRCELDTCRLHFRREFFGGDGKRCHNAAFDRFHFDGGWFHNHVVAFVIPSGEAGLRPFTKVLPRRDHGAGGGPVALSGETYRCDLTHQLKR